LPLTTSQRNRIVKLKQSFLFIRIQKNALPLHSFKNHFNIILPSLPMWPFFCFIYKLLGCEGTYFILVNTETHVY
jgi:hypothetical protein